MIFEALAPSRDGRTVVLHRRALVSSGHRRAKNWIAAAGVLFETTLQGEVVDYQPCYRSAAGTGTANGFVYWN